MHKLLVMALMGLTAAAQTQIDLATQAKRVDFSNASSTKPLQTGTSLPSACAVGQMFFKTDAPAGANLYACTATNTWSAQGGITGTNCWADASSQTLRCQDTSGNVYAVVRTATSGTANQWVDYIGTNGAPHTSQPTAGAVGAVADPGSNGVPYRSGAGTATAASADQMSGPFFCQDGGTSGAYGCSLTPAVAGYTAGTTYWFRANTANTGSATLNLNGLGAKAIVKQANQALAANDIRAGQWVMVTYDGANMQMQSQTGNASGGSVSSVFGRVGAVTAQTGDYTFSQIGGTASAAQLPAVAMRTDQGNAVTAGTQDFSQSAHTLPMKSGSTAAMPATCSVGETYFATDAAAGNNLFGCTAANVWSQQAGSTFTVKASGTVVGLRNTLNLIPGLGLAPIVTDTGSQINVQLPIDPAVTDTRLNAASGADLLVTPTSNSGTAYAGCPSGITPPVTTGMVVHLTPDHSSTGGATTFNYCSTSAAALKEADGTSNLTSTDLIAGRQQDIWYDGSVWRLKTSGSGGSGGSMTWPSSAGVAVYGGSSAWGSSLPVGTSANNLVQLNGSGQLPAVSAALLTGFPTLNQSTTGNAGTATSLAAGAAGSIPYQTAAGTTGFVAGNASGSTDAVLTSTSVSGSYSATALKNAPALSAANMTGFPTLNQNTTGSAASFTGSLSGDVTGTQTATSVGKVNGAGVPASANALASNGSSQIVSGTSHNLSVPANCVAASGSGTAYTCVTSPTFTPATGDHIQFKADVANTGSATLAVNGASAATIKKWGGAGTLIANDLLAGHWISATFDGTYWQLEGQLGNSGLSGGSSYAVPYQSAAGATAFLNGNTAATDQVLVSHGTGSAAQAPVLKSISDVETSLYVAGGGTAQAQTVTLAPAATSLTAGLTVRWKPAAANTGAAPTLAVNSLTATAITKCGTAALVAGDLSTTAVAMATYDGTQFQLINPQAAGCPTSQSDIPTFVICTTTGCQAETTFNNWFVSAPNGITFDECGFALQTAPTVQTVIVDIQTAAGISIFGTTKLQIAANATTTNFQSTFSSSPYTAAKGAQFKAVVTQSDTGGAALGGYVKCRVH
jgi:hypothetical protein